ncbi:unnamed protein product [Rotaria socialis]|uniref:Uncharacterized protein n=3 Tax=Rotaria socialis TaxID=392032 RepID=A0A818Z0N3_9BILA|nr:unnamed protein product [Rotaria socialis]CAF4496032.1 unnamed protein product [Rotaria socialis]
MGKPKHDDSQIFVRTSSPTSILPSPVDLDMNWHTALSQSDPSLQSRQNPCTQRFPTNGYNTSSYKVSIGHETVNITEIARHGEPTINPKMTVTPAERRRFIAARKGADVLSLCFMCFVSASLILIAISTMHLLVKTNYMNNNDLVPLLLQSTNMTPGFLYMFGSPVSTADSASNILVAVYDRTIRDLATVICLLIVVLNCFCLLVFSIEIYLGCNAVKTKTSSYRFVFSSSTSRFIAICCFYASIPALILVMCLFILLNMTLIPAIISLAILGLGLTFILITLLTYFAAWQNNNFSTTNDKLAGINSIIYRNIGVNHIGEDDIDLAKADELSTLV